MAASAIALVLLSAAMHVGWNLLVKSSADPRAFSAVSGIPFLVMGLCVVVWLPLADLSPVIWACVAGSGVIHAVYFLGLTNAYVEGDLSLVYPITRSSPAFVALIAFIFFGEEIGALAGLGIAIVVVCIAALHVSSSDSSDLNDEEDGAIGWRSLRSFRGLARNRYAFLTLATVVAYSIIDKAGMAAFEESLELERILWAPVYFLLINGVSVLLFWTWMALRGLPGVRFALRHEWKPALLASLGTFASYSLILHVFETERVSYVVALRQASVLIAVGVGWLWLGERGGRMRMLAALALLVGLALVALSN